MLGIFKNGLVGAPKELKSPSHDQHQHHHQNQDPLNRFLNSNPNTFSFSFGNDASLAFDTSSQQRLFSSMDDIYCIFLGGLDNLCTLNKQYGLTKVANEPMFVIQAYKTLRDRGPYPAHSVLKELEGTFGFILYDVKAKTVFVSLGADGGVKLFWGIGADGSVVISDNLEVIKSSCSKSFAPFPTGKDSKTFYSFRVEKQSCVFIMTCTSFKDEGPTLAWVAPRVEIRHNIDKTNEAIRTIQMGQ